MAYYDIKQHGVITNGMFQEKTIAEYEAKGYVHLATKPAKDFHPYAAENDTIHFFAVPISKKEYDAGKKEWEYNNAVHTAMGVSN